MEAYEVLLMVFAAMLSSALMSFGVNSALECRRREATVLITFAGGVSSLGILVVVEHFTRLMIH